MILKMLATLSRYSCFSSIPYITQYNDDFIYDIIREPFAKFVDSPHYSESELCGGAVTICFSNYLPWQAIYFLQRSTHFTKTCCRPFAASFRRIVEQAVLTSELPFHGWKSPAHGVRSGLYDGCSNGDPPISVSASIATFQSCNADAPLRLLRHPKKGSFKTTVTLFSRRGGAL
jgi:hypothetical protein